MPKMSVTVIALAAAIGMTAWLPGAIAEEKLSPEAPYDKALNDRNQLDNPDRRQQCQEKAKQGSSSKRRSPA